MTTHKLRITPFQIKLIVFAEIRVERGAVCWRGGRRWWVLVQFLRGPPMLCPAPGSGGARGGTSHQLGLLLPSAYLTHEALPSGELLEASEAKQCHLAYYLK